MPTIGTLNEKPLHEALKQWYALPGDRLEVPVAGFVVDIVRGDLLIEIQTRNFSAIRHKLERLVAGHPTRLVYPIPHEKWIVRLAADGESTVGRRRSPKRGSFEHAFEELVRIPALLTHPNFSLELVLIEEEELRRYDGVRGWRRGGWVTQERRLLRVLESRTLSKPSDMAAFLPDALAEVFSASDLATALAVPRRLAQRMVYCLRSAGCVTAVGKKANAILYRRLNL